MLFHKFDLETNLYVESVELESQPENSTDTPLPEMTEHYTIALIEGSMVSVLKPEFEVINNEIVFKQD